MAPLCADVGWLQSLNRISLDLITLMEHFDCQENTCNEAKISETEDKKDEWPPQKEDFIIKGLLQRSRPIQLTSIDIHRGVIWALRVHSDLSLLPMCFPSFDELFLHSSLFQDFPLNYTSNEYQIPFINDALESKADFMTGEFVDLSDLEHIMNLGISWGLDKKEMLTYFIITMYEMGKDNMVDDLINIGRQVEVSQFIDNAVDIVCVRLNTTLTLMKKVKEYRGVIGMLDADTCHWVKEKAGIAIQERPRMTHIVKQGKPPPLENTHSLILRIMRLDSESKSQVHALSIMSGTLLRVVEQFGL